MAGSVEGMPSVMSGLPCVLCGGPKREPVAGFSPVQLDTTREFVLVRCTSCELVMTEPQLEGRELEAYYRPEYWGHVKADDSSWLRHNQSPRTVFLERFLSGGRLLDVGCGLGLFLLALDPARWQRYGLEVMPEAYRQSVQWLGADRIFRADLTAARLPREHFDVVSFWDVLEHLPDPCAALKEAYRLLRPGGLVLLRLPNFASHQARHFREDWYALALPYHLYHFTPATVTRSLEASGFRIRALENCLGQENHCSLRHSLLNRMTRRHGPRGGRLRYYLLKPFLRPWEWITTRPTGGSCLQVCAERPPAYPA